MLKSTWKKLWRKKKLPEITTTTAHLYTWKDLFSLFSQMWYHLLRKLESQEVNKDILPWIWLITKQIRRKLYKCANVSLEYKANSIKTMRSTLCSHHYIMLSSKICLIILLECHACIQYVLIILTHFRPPSSPTTFSLKSSCFLF